MKATKKTFTVTMIASNVVWGFFGKWGQNTPVVNITFDEFNERKYLLKFNY